MSGMAREWAEAVRVALLPLTGEVTVEQCGEEAENGWGVVATYDTNSAADKEEEGGYCSSLIEDVQGLLRFLLLVEQVQAAQYRALVSGAFVAWEEEQSRGR
jgi:hypothetical protein